MSHNIPAALQKRVPLIQPQWMDMLEKLGEHPHAPAWNTQCGDRLTHDDIPFINDFEEALHNERTSDAGHEPGERLITWILSMQKRSPWFAKSLKGLTLPKDFSKIPFMMRRNMQQHIDLIVPIDEELERLVVNPTSGTTGQPIPCPNHPKAVGCYDPLIQFTLQRHGLVTTYDHSTVAAIQLCAQKKTITYYTVHSYFKGAGFAKINLFENEWPGPESSGIYINDMQPVFLSGDPFAFYRGMQLKIGYKPKVMLSTAITLDPAMRKKLEAYYRCPLVDFYSLNETGPIAYSCPDHPDRFHQLPTDIYIEIINDEGEPCRDDEPGEITITGGRNPYLPLLRYKTGDRAAINHAPCSCGDPMPYLTGMSARKLVIFYNQAGTPVNPIDISRIMRQYPVAMHQVIQAKDQRCRIRILPDLAYTPAVGTHIVNDIKALFDNQIDVGITTDLDPAEGKFIPYINESNPESS